MKRCPQCEFIYEEDQRVCDMDGAALVHDPGVLMDHAPLVVTPSAKSGSRLLAHLGIPLVILSVVGFYVFNLPTPSRNAPPRTAITSNRPGSAGASSPAAKPNEATPSSTSGADAANDDSRSESSSAVDRRQTSDDPASFRGAKVPSSRIKPPSTSPTSKRLRSEPQANPKKESKVTSFLKKTGRFLKKPFQL